MNFMDDDRLDVASMKNPCPEGVLVLRVTACENLKGADMSIMGKPTSDPYLRIKVGTRPSPATDLKST